MDVKNLQLERLVFFCDAVVAIAITLLALDIKIHHAPDGHLSFSDITGEWRTFVAFSLSFLNIANFWKTHHSLFSYINKIDEKLLWYNICWLFFIVLLPFSTSLVSNYFNDTAAIFTYSLNTLLIAVFQNAIWDYASKNMRFLKKEIVTAEIVRHSRLFCNLEMVNALLAIAVSFFRPHLAFIVLFTKLPMILLAGLYRRRMAESKGGRAKNSGPMA